MENNYQRYGKTRVSTEGCWKKPQTFQIFWIIFRIVDPMGGWAGIIETSVTDAFATSNVLLWLIHPLSISLWLEAFWFSITSLCSLLDMNIEFWYIAIQKRKDVQMVRKYFIECSRFYGIIELITNVFPLTCFLETAFTTLR